MVNTSIIGSVTAKRDERLLALRYAPEASRAGLAALLALDDRLGAILRSTREPLVGQMRLTWWHEALCSLDTTPPPAEPVLAALAREVVPSIAGTTLATMIEGWEALLDPQIDQAALETHAAARGSRLFRAMAAVIGTGADGIAGAGRGWALADIALHVSDTRIARQARVAAQEALSTAVTACWPGRLRALGAMAHLARMDVEEPSRPVGHPSRAARILWHRLSGR